MIILPERILRGRHFIECQGASRSWLQFCFFVSARAREKARQSSCLLDLKQLGLALSMYVQDYDETYLEGSDYNPDGGMGTFRGTCLHPYVKN
jgi:hypothetical protein